MTKFGLENHLSRLSTLVHTAEQDLILSIERLYHIGLRNVGHFGAFSFYRVVTEINVALPQPISMPNNLSAACEE